MDDTDSLTTDFDSFDDGSLGMDGSTLDGGIDSVTPIISGLYTYPGASLANLTPGIAASTSSPSALGGFFSSLATDASSLLGGLTNRINVGQAIATNQQLQQNGYTVPLTAPGLNGAFNTSTLMLLALVAFAFFMMVK